MLRHNCVDISEPRITRRIATTSECTTVHKAFVNIFIQILLSLMGAHALQEKNSLKRKAIGYLEIGSSINIRVVVRLNTP